LTSTSDRGTSDRPHLAVVAVAVLTIALTVFIRVRLLSVPLERDEGEYAYAGQLILHGELPYQSAYNMKLPGAYYMYAVSEALLGQSDRAIHLALVIVNLICCVFMFRLAREFFSPAVSWAATASFALLSVSPAVLGITANAEHFVILFSIPGTWLLLRAIRSGSRLTLLGSGLMLGAAVLMKQHALFIAAGAGLYYAVALLQRPAGSAARLGRMALFGGAIALPYALIAWYFVMRGVFKDFWFFTVIYARAYVSINDPLSGVLRTPAAHHLHDNWALALLGIAGVCWILASRVRLRTHAFLLVFLLFSLLSVYPGFYFRPHYFVMLLPAAALMIGAGFAAIGGFLNPRQPARIGAVLFSLVVAAPPGWFAARHHAFAFTWTPAETSRQLYGDAPFVEIRDVAAFIEAHSGPDDLIANVGAEPEVLFYANRRSASGFLYCYPLIENQPYAGEMRRQWFSEMERARPLFAVFAHTDAVWVDRPFREDAMRWWSAFREGYTKVGVVNDVSSAASTAYFGDDSDRLRTTSDNFIEVYRRR
jgi:hypothetical protein